MALIFFLIVLSVLVLIHEAGHYVAARIFKVKADEFGYGFPPRAIGFVRDGGRWKKVGRGDRREYQNTIWSLNWLPLGGFVRIKGEQADGQNDADSFHMQPVWKRMVILAAGVAMNWLLAFVLFVIVFTIGTKVELDGLPAGAVIRDSAVRITQVLPGSSAEKAGLQIDDAILRVAGAPIQTYAQARDLIAAQGEAPYAIQVERDGNTIEQTVQSTYEAQLGRVALGVGIADVGLVSFPFLTSLKVSATATYGYTKAIILTFYDILKKIFTRHEITEQIAGPVGVAVITGQMAKLGIVPLLQFSAILSINLAVINFLPIPALDGGRFLFLAIEKLRRRSMNRALEAAIHNIAFMLLIILILFVTISDVSKYSSDIIGGLRGLVGM
ncbi:site-2 protease family protein [Patescibacteria group bacterium]|nr:site-2 protease family protein [Patescibacteria group bacterium]